MKLIILMLTLLFAGASVYAQNHQQSKYEMLKQSFNTANEAIHLDDLETFRHSCATVNIESPNVAKSNKIYKLYYKDIFKPADPGEEPNGPLFPGRPATPPIYIEKLYYRLPHQSFRYDDKDLTERDVETTELVQEATEITQFIKEATYQRKVTKFFFRKKERMLFVRELVWFNETRDLIDYSYSYCYLREN